MRPTFREIFDSQAAYVLGRLRWLGVPERDRPDVAQEIFADIARHADELDPARPLRPWVATVTLNAARDYHRRAHVRLEKLDGEPIEPVTEDRVHDRHDAAQVLRQLLESLQYDHREVLVLHEIEERPAPEIAAMLHVSVKTIESRIARARERLMEAFARLRATDARRGVASVAALGLVDLDELLRASRDVHEDIGAEVELLRQRLTRFPAPAAAVQATPAATWVGLGFVFFVAGAGTLHAITRPDIVRECPVVEAQPAPAPAIAPAAITVAPSSTASSSPPPPPAPSPCARATSPAPSTPAEMSEVELLSFARRALREGAPRRAIVFLRRHERAYPKGRLAPERIALLAQAAR